ncbi:MAG TPA: hypothetical protein VHN14_28840 [Kofleriaceae bacterium]|nr:hypothetical protein [Kofleriaceae bacterium]
MNKLAVIVLSVGLVACSQKKPEEGREPAQTAAPGAVVGSAVSGAPAPGAAAPATSGTGGAAPGSAAGSSGVACASAAALACGAGQSDGCTRGLTSVHVCVASDATAGPSCAQETRLSCPAGQVDACLHDPPQATNHVCVIGPTTTTP